MTIVSCCALFPRRKATEKFSSASLKRIGGRLYNISSGVRSYIRESGYPSSTLTWLDRAWCFEEASNGTGGDASKRVTVHTDTTTKAPERKRGVGESRIPGRWPIYFASAFMACLALAAAALLSASVCWVTRECNLLATCCGKARNAAPSLIPEPQEQQQQQEQQRGHRELRLKPTRRVTFTGHLRSVYGDTDRSGAVRETALQVAENGGGGGGGVEETLAVAASTCAASDAIDTLRATSPVARLTHSNNVDLSAAKAGAKFPYRLYRLPPPPGSRSGRPPRNRPRRPPTAATAAPAATAPAPAAKDTRSLGRDDEDMENWNYGPWTNWRRMAMEEDSVKGSPSKRNFTRMEEGEEEEASSVSSTGLDEEGSAGDVSNGRFADFVGGRLALHM